MRLGACYYPEHWPERLWRADARAMAEAGFSLVRIGEFAWSRLEPEPGRLDFAWLDRAIEALAAEGLGVILCTPTATPPKWLVERHPEILAVHPETGRPRRFGSRRHYDFSSPAYRREAARMVEALATRYGAHPAVVAWQTDNEYGCHDTVESGSEAAAAAFRRWLEARYGEVARLNEAWGSVFWSQEVQAFDQVDPPLETVTEANPAARLDWRRFASEEVAEFNRVQTEILRRASPGRTITHNFMGFYDGFDPHRLSRDLDAAAWDSYPLGFLESFWFPEAEKAAYAERGHPDVAAFHHDLYRACGRGRFLVMEQQPGPVNWAPYNPAPAPGTVRLWTLEALAHGAEALLYFRWRQAPFAQEQMHAGLNRPDGSADVGLSEATAAGEAIRALGELAPPAPAPVALLLDFEGLWALGVQPQGRGYSPLRLAFEAYSGLRELGLDVDVVFPDDDLSGRRLIVCPALPIVRDDLVRRLAESGAEVVLFPRSGSRTPEHRIPDDLPPGPLQAVLPLRVLGVESRRPGTAIPVRLEGREYGARLWRERVETAAEAPGRFADGGPALVEALPFTYLAAWPETDLMRAVLTRAATRAGLATLALPEGVRIRRRGDLVFAFNFGAVARDLPVDPHARFLLGSPRLDPSGVAAWRVPAATR